MALSITSYFDNRVILDQNNWCVTLIAQGGPSGNHAQLVVEGVGEKGAFRKIVHLRGLTSFDTSHKKLATESYCYYGFGKIGKVFIHDLNLEKEIGYNRKSETWIRSAEKVRTMLLEVEKEAKDQLAHPQPFNIFGRKSVFANKVATFKIEDDFLKEFYKIDKNFFGQLYEEMKRNFVWIKKGIDYQNWWFRYYNPFLPFNRDSNYLGNNTAVNVAYEGFLEGFKFFLPLPSTVRFTWPHELFVELIETTDENRKEFIEKNAKSEKESQWLSMFHKRLENTLAQERSDPRAVFFQSKMFSILSKLQEIPEIQNQVTVFQSHLQKDVIHAYREVLNYFCKNIKRVHLPPDSCFSWSREKLKLVDVKIEDQWFERVISPTKAYLPPKHQSCDIQ